MRWQPHEIAARATWHYACVGTVPSIFSKFVGEKNSVTGTLPATMPTNCRLASGWPGRALKTEATGSGGGWRLAICIVMPKDGPASASRSA